MNDRANIRPEQGRIARLAEIQVVQFVRDALRAGERAILVTDRGPAPVRTPDAALAGFVGQTLRVAPALAEPYELQRMIGAAVGIAGGGEMAPLAFVARLLFAAPGASILLAIDDAHQLSPRSLAYLAEITELLAPDAPILQIVLAARPVLLDTLAQPEYEGLRSRLCRPAHETLPAPPEAEDEQALAEAGGPAQRAAKHPERSLNAEPGAAPSKLPAVGRLAAQAVAGATALGCLAAIGYVALPAASNRLLWPPTPIAPAAPPKESARLDPKQAGGVADQLIDALADAVANGPAESVADLIQRIASVESGASPEGLRLVTAMPDRFSARATAAAAAGRVDEARRLEQFLLLTYPARVRPDLLMPSKPGSSASSPSVAAGGGDARAPGAPALAERPLPPASESAPSAGPAGRDDRAAVSPNDAHPAAQSPAAPPAIVARVAPTAPKSVPTPSAEQPGLAAPHNRAAASSMAPAPAAPGAAPERSGDAAPAIVARAAPETAPPPAAEQPVATGQAERASEPPVAGSPAAASAAPDRNGAAAPTTIMAREEAQRPAARLRDLPALAPVRVVLDVARDEFGPAGRAATIRQALVAAGFEVAQLVPVDDHGPGPSVGYYFQSDRKAAAGVGHLLEPLLGPVNPVALRMRGNVPEPGTIEIEVR